jgi:hypothetical protein
LFKWKLIKDGSLSRSATIPTELIDSEWTFSNKMTPNSLHPPGIQFSSHVTPVEPKQMVPKPHSSPNRDYEAVLQRFDCIALVEGNKVGQDGVARLAM